MLRMLAANAEEKIRLEDMFELINKKIEDQLL